ncbi:lysylphosphatidylglycerol synthase transmembrane domain-containing protein [Methanococcoides methylutens]|nr:lysylphosphatidylglycerol synthase transmembrane domain-containing protein [Methanococcoides methylutens]
MNRFFKWLVISLLLSFTSIVFLLVFTVDTTTIDSILNIKKEAILAAIALQVFSYIVWGLRTKFMCQSLGHDISLLKTTEIAISSLLVAAVTPSSAGGEALRVHLLSKNEIPIGQATSVVIGERLTDAFLILVTAPIALYIFRGVIPGENFDILLITGEAVLLSALGILIYAVWKPHRIKRMIHFLVHRTRRFHGRKTDEALAHLLKKVDTEVDDFHFGLRYLLRKGRRGLLYGTICTIIYRCTLYSILPIILSGLNQPPEVVVAFAAQILLTIVMIIPATPGASGVAEFGASSLFSVLVASPALIGITVLAWRALTYYTNIIAGSFVSLKVLKDADFMSSSVEK